MQSTTDLLQTLCLSTNPEGMGQLDHGIPYTWHQTPLVRSADLSSTHLLPSPLLLLLEMARHPAAQDQGLLLAACEARVTAVPHLGLAPTTQSTPQPHMMFVLVLPKIKLKMFFPAVKYCLVLPLQHCFIDPWTETKAHKLLWPLSSCC